MRLIDCCSLVSPMATLPKELLVAEKVALDPETSPMPFREKECGLPWVSSVMVIVALRGPACAGLKTAEIMQLPPAAKVVSHVWFPPNSELSPPIATLEIVMGDRTTFVTVTACAALTVPSNWGAKSKPEGESVRLSPPSKTETVYCWLPDPPDESVTCM